MVSYDIEATHSWIFSLFVLHLNVIVVVDDVNIVVVRIVDYRMASK